MTIVLVYQILMGFTVAFGAYVFLALQRSGWRRWGGPAFFGLMLAGMIMTTMLSLGIPRPLWTFAYDNTSYSLIAWLPIENKGIYLWVAPADGSDPVVVQLPWSKQSAEAVTQEMFQLNQSNQEGDVQLGSLARGQSKTVVTAHSLSDIPQNPLKPK